MDQKSKEAFIKQVITIASNAKAPGAKAKRRMTFKANNEKGVAYTLHDEILDSYEDLVGSLLKRRSWGEKFSERYMINVIDNMLADILRDEHSDNAAGYFEQLIKGFNNFNREQVVLVPTEGLALYKSKLQLGNVVLKRMSRTTTNKLARELESLIRANKHTTPDDKALIIKNLRSDLIEDIQGTVCAEFRIIAEPIRARERAEEETRRVLDLIRFSIPFLFSSNINIMVGPQGESPTGKRSTPVISANGDSFSWSLDRSSFPLSLSSEHLKIMRKIGVLKVSEILKKPGSRLTDFEDTIIRGVHWFADGQIQPEIEGKFLSLTTCLETFLTPKDRDPITNAIAEGIAMILARGINNRRYLKQRIKKLYGMRSGVSHGGQKAILDTDLDELLHIAKFLVPWMIKKSDQFETKDNLLYWLEGQKLK